MGLFRSDSQTWLGKAGGWAFLTTSGGAAAHRGGLYDISISRRISFLAVDLVVSMIRLLV